MSISVHSSSSSESINAVTAVTRWQWFTNELYQHLQHHLCRHNNLKFSEEAGKIKPFCSRTLLHILFFFWLTEMISDLFWATGRETDTFIQSPRGVRRRPVMYQAATETSTCSARILVVLLWWFMSFSLYSWRIKWINSEKCRDVKRFFRQYVWACSFLSLRNQEQMF